MVEAACPSCGAPVRFQSSISVYAVCPYCQSMLVRRDLDIESIGQMAMLPPETTPLQLGTMGRVENINFTLLGRLRIGWEDGFWNEWYALFDDGRSGWLAEAQGFYMISFELEEAEIPGRASLKPLRNVPLAGVQYRVDDIKDCWCVSSEGELPFAAPAGRRSTSIDLSGPEGAFATLDYSDDGNAVYVGKYLEFDEFKFTNLRELEGWKP